MHYPSPPTLLLSMWIACSVFPGQSTNPPPTDATVTLIPTVHHGSTGTEPAWDTVHAELQAMFDWTNPTTQIQIGNPTGARLSVSVVQSELSTWVSNNSNVQPGEQPYQVGDLLLRAERSTGNDRVIRYSFKINTGGRPEAPRKAKANDAYYSIMVEHTWTPPPPPQKKD